MDDVRELKKRMLKALTENKLNEFQLPSEDAPDQTFKQIDTEKNAKDISARDLLKITRNYDKEGLQKKSPDTIEKTIKPTEEREEQQKFENFFKDNNVIVDFQPLKIKPHGVFWGGTIDGQIQWVYKVTPYEEKSGVDINILDGYQKNDTENEEIIQKLENYYDTFYKYWRDNEIDNEMDI